MKTTSILIIVILLTIQINAQNTIAYEDCSTEISTPPSKGITSQPEFPGGKKELAKYLSNNIRYPRNSRNSSSRGSVIVCFKIEKDGTIADVKVLKGVNKILNKEAKRVVSNMPNWKPAYEDGIAISKVLRIPIVFFRN